MAARQMVDRPGQTSLGEASRLLRAQLALGLVTEVAGGPLMIVVESACSSRVWRAWR